MTEAQQQANAVAKEAYDKAKRHGACDDTAWIMAYRAAAALPVPASVAAAARFAHQTYHAEA